MAFIDMPVTVPCGQCIGCRLDRSRQWAIRCVHEAQMHEHNSFITLTYNDDKLPPDRSLDLRHFQLFMKKLRTYLADNGFPKIRFYHCGEYGAEFGRPHYHSLIFGHDFPDKTLWKTVNELPLYRSATLEDLWTDGFSSIGTVTFESAAYVARYILKKITGECADDHYCEIDPETGEVLSHRRPEYTTMSRRPGIGSAWLDKYLTDVYPSDEVILRGRSLRPPKYYDSRYELLHPKEHLELKARRKRESALHLDNQTPERLNVRAVIQQKRLNLLPRKLS